MTQTLAPALKRESPWRRNAAEFFASRTAVFGLVVTVLLFLAAALVTCSP
ncbi:ABC transporter permease [Bordetella holmesii]|uniref:Oligopeptide transport permease C-like N-terminal domain-containing protein n=2 Tax=Bordetella holmesii TaxID=35814 RepID=A0A158M585_9BORD|nr:N-terminal TM domain of oligopeptide transport permease C family protein [Bordetella holmesii ATCC 51541]AIT28467.1 N-terminal TM domain of oligopeptide transport permease C family protein [Bordetella holmesii 44057]AMD47123.1 ABC transporter permease [Bordetella holmesii H558]AMD50463.1 hypothetical protein F783_000615 [Bordetella holmesii F627]AOB36024.1 ABC transporter permease [Bordetella holmesii]EWM41257.1 N-terminal TM domain of oligopeptide transport permease C family protein [Borde